MKPRFVSELLQCCCRASAALIATTAAASAATSSSQTASCEASTEGSSSQSWDNRRVFFKYEKRLREFSTHEKMFEYFSTQTQDGRKCMTASDVLRSVLAVYPPDAAQWNRSGSLAGESAPKVDHVRFAFCMAYCCILRAHPAFARSLFQLNTVNSWLSCLGQH